MAERTPTLEFVAQKYLDARGRLGLGRAIGLTRVYHLFHNPAESSASIDLLRQLQVEMDCAVSQAYKWTDVDLGHAFHETKQGVRFSVSPIARQKILDRLLELNHQRYSEEVAQGLHEKRSPKGKARGTPAKGKRSDPSSPLLEGV